MELCKRPAGCRRPRGRAPRPAPDSVAADQQPARRERARRPGGQGAARPAGEGRPGPDVPFRCRVSGGRIPLPAQDVRCH